MSDLTSIIKNEVLESSYRTTNVPLGKPAVQELGIIWDFVISILKSKLLKYIEYKSSYTFNYTFLTISVPLEFDLQLKISLKNRFI